MSHIPLKATQINHFDHAVELPENRRQSPQADFGATLQSVQANMELSMANRFLEQSMAQEGGGTAASGTPFSPQDMGSSMRMDMLATLTKLQESHQAENQPKQSTQDGTNPAEHALSADNAAQSAEQTGEETGKQDIPGRLATLFESGGDPGRIGWDRMGGTSYGIFQLSSRQGTLEDFIGFLRQQAPELASRLEGAGEGNTGSTQGAMPDAWRELAQDLPERFAELQRAFVGDSHYRPALEGVLENLGLSGLKESQLPEALREVLFSTSVQHGAGGAQSIFNRALESLGGLDSGGLDGNLVRSLIDKVYEIRSGQFGGSTERVQEAVRNRFASERNMALAMLSGDSMLG
ncbi:hypothetical protein [Desulfohalovibrio reitneri]|uniref:VgrG-related protein n=1 Tax=Desulfohalovibrio reitneri TaxID=1307759 RepID=UPI00055549BE|nr:hypothetical protein [Desulfohalovibrio reitneri]